MKQLAGLDATFLHLETPEMPMHVGALHVFEFPKGWRGDWLQQLRGHVASRLPLMAPLRKRIAEMPLNVTNPAWVDCDPDLDWHIVPIKLKKNAGMAELEAAVGQLHPVLLDRSRPLWRFHVFDGLEPGPDGEVRVGVYTQVHHAAVDGQAAVALATVLFDLGPEPRTLTLPPPKARRGQLGMAGMLRAAVVQQWKQTLNLAKALPGAAATLTQMAAQTAGGAATGTWQQLLAKLTGKDGKGAKVSNLGLAPRTRLNVSLSDTRSYATVSLPLAELNRIRRRHGASLNDAVVFVIGGALRRLFQKHGPLPRKSLVAAVPVSTRASGDTTSNTQATMSVMSLGTHLADPAARLAHVLASSAAMKAQLDGVKSLMPTDFPSIGLPWLMQMGARLYGRAQVAERLPALANVVISNVPGPAMPLYLAGAKMLCNYPTSIAVHGIALNITVQSYDQHLDMGLMACAEALPETAELAAHIETAFQEFAALPVAEIEAETAPPPARKAPAKTATKKAAPRKSVARATKTPRAAAKKAAKPRASSREAARASR